MIRKAVTKPIWYWEKYRTYPIREVVYDFPPMRCEPGSRHNLVVLATPDAINNAAWTAYSLLVQLQPAPLGLILVVDGELQAADVERLQHLFVGIRIERVSRMVAQLGCDAIKALYQIHPMAGKLAVILRLQQETPILFSDDDVLAFGRLREIEQFINEPTAPNRYLVELGGESGVEPNVLRVVQQMQLPVAAAINVGFLAIQQHSLNIELAGKILANTPTMDTWFPDTTVLACLMAQAGGVGLPVDTYRVSVERQFFFQSDCDYDAIALRHFVSPVRHLMYMRGMPRLRREYQANGETLGFA